MITIGYVSSLKDPIVRIPVEEESKQGLHSLQIYTRSNYKVATANNYCIVLRLKNPKRASTEVLVFHGPSKEMQPLLAHANKLLERSA